MKKKIYIAGAGGMLGEAFYRVFKGDFDLKCTDKDLNENWLIFIQSKQCEKLIDTVFTEVSSFLCA